MSNQIPKTNKASDKSSQAPLTEGGSLGVISRHKNSEDKVRGAKEVRARHLNDNQRAEIRELFESVYVANKWHIIRMNFVRGIAFGLGTFLGGTIVVAIVVWILSQTVDIFPWARDFTQNIIDSLKK